MTGFALDIVDDTRGLDDLREPWDALWAAAPERSVFLTWAWAAAWWRHFRLGDRLSVMVVRDGADIVALAPFSRAGYGFEVLFGLGQEAADYSGFLFRTPSAAAPIVEHLVRRAATGRTVVNLGRLPDDSATLALLRDATTAPHAAPVALHRDFDEEYPYLDLGALEDPVRHVAKLQKRNDVRRRLRRLGEQHDVQFTYREQPVGPALDAFLALHDRRWSAKDAEASGVFASPKGRAFLRDVAPALYDQVRISSVRADGEPVAMRFGFEDRGHYYGAKSAFAPDFAPYGPGHLVVGLLLQHLAEHGATEFDFMRGAGEHKDAWAGATRRVGYWSLARRGPVGDAGRRLRWQLLRLRARLRAR